MIVHARGNGAVVDRGLIARGTAAWTVERLVVAFAACGVVALLYYPVGQLTQDRQVELMTALDLAIPFVPATVWIYMPLYLALFFAGAVGVRDRDIFYRTIGTVALSSAICCAAFLVWPSTMPWPPLPDEPGLTRELLAWVRTIDVPNNTFPSQHVALSFCVAFGAWRFRRGLGAILFVAAVLVSLSTMTTKQHYWIDSPGGLAVAIVAHAVVFSRYRRASA